MTFAVVWESAFLSVTPVLPKGRRTRHRRSSTILRAKDNDLDAKQSFLDNAALDFNRGIEAGMTADEIVRIQMGVGSQDELTEVQIRYKDKMIEKLTKRAEELKKKSKKCEAFEAGKLTYGRGDYPLACKCLEQAALEHAEGSILGGEIRLWLALTYHALGQTDECVALFKRLQESHPDKRTRTQAKDLQFIIEAPRLKLNEDERVKLPILKDAERAPPRISYTRSPSRSIPRSKSSNKKSFEDSFWENYRPPQLRVPNRYVWAASIAICLGLICYSVLYKSPP